MADAAITYAYLLRRPDLRAVLAAACLSRLAGRMFGLIIVIHALTAFASAEFAGWIACAAVAPGLLISPLAGAFLDRAGAARGIAVDMAVSAAVAIVLAASVISGLESPSLLLGLSVIYALTTPLSRAGIRVVLPRLVPTSALDRTNALDTAIHSVVDVAGPSAAGVIIGFFGAEAALVAIAICQVAAAVCMAAVRLPTMTGSAAGPSKAAFLAQAWEGVSHVLQRPTLRGLAIGYALNLTTWGILTVAVPVVLAARYPAGVWEAMSGLLWAGAGVASGVGAVVAGKSRVAGREKPVMALCMAASALAAWPVASEFGVEGLALGLALVGLLAGPIDVGVLTLRQRRTDPAVLGRVLAVSMSLNMSGFPVGAALGGILTARDPHLAFLAAALASLLAAAATLWLIPTSDDD